MFHSDSKANIEAIETTEGTVGVFHHQTPPLDSGKAIQAGAEVQTQCLKGRQGLEVLAGDRLAHDLLKATLLQYRSAMSNAQISLSKALAVLSKLHSRAHQTAEARMVQLHTFVNACLVLIGVHGHLDMGPIVDGALKSLRFVLNSHHILGQTLHHTFMLLMYWLYSYASHEIVS